MILGSSLKTFFCRRTSGNVCGVSSSDAEDNDEGNSSTPMQYGNGAKRIKNEEQDAMIGSPSMFVVGPVSSLASIDTGDSLQQNGARSLLDEPSVKRACRKKERQGTLSGSDELTQTFKDVVQVMSACRVPNQHTVELSVDEHYGLSVGKTLARMTPRQSAVAKLRIQQVLLDVEFSKDCPAPLLKGCSVPLSRETSPHSATS